jgi:hypothetical protein
MNSTTSRNQTRRIGRGLSTRIGLDIGKHAAKLVVANRLADGWRVSHAACLRFSSNDPLSAQELSAQLGVWLRKHNIPTSFPIVANLSSEMVDYEIMEEQTLDPNALKEVSQEALVAVMGNDASLATHDYWTAERKESSQSLCLAWTPTDYEVRNHYRTQERYVVEMGSEWRTRCRGTSCHFTDRDSCQCDRNGRQRSYSAYWQFLVPRE